MELSEKVVKYKFLQEFEIMKKNLFLIVVFISIINFVNGQSEGDSVEYKRIAGTYMFIQKGEVLSINQVIYLMRDYKVPSKFLYLARSFRSIGRGFGIAGGATVGFFAAKALLLNESFNLPCIFVGIGFVIVGNIANTRVPVYIKGAVNHYNKALLYEKHKRAKLNLGITPNGFGLNLSF
jgi:hypothetical protein